MTAYQVTSLNRHAMVEITHHYTPSWAEFEMHCRRLCGHSAIQSRQVSLQPAPLGCLAQPKPGKGKGAGR